MTSRIVVLLIPALLPAQPPIPRMQAIPLPGGQISFQRHERELARYHFDAANPRPFVFPIIGPSGRSLTRMGHPGDPDGHSHHNSVWFTSSNVNGVDFWSDRGGGRIVHKRIEHLEDGEDRALAIGRAEWVTSAGAVLLDERRHVLVQLLPRDEWFLILDLELRAPREPVTVAAAAFGPIGVRMAKWISVHFGGGTLRNSEGAEGEVALFRKPARWVDYAGRTAPGVIEGIVLMDHPSNPYHPSPFHVREDGWMGAMLSLEKPTVIEPAKPLSLRYGLYVHAGARSREAIDAKFEEFAATPLRAPFGPPRTERDCLHGGHRLLNRPRTFRSAAECLEFVRRPPAPAK